MENEKTQNKDEVKISKNVLHDEVVAALLKEAERRGLKDCEIDIAPGSDKGDNYLGIVTKITVTGRHAEENVVRWNWIAKTAPQTDVYRNLLRIDVAYEREVYMYTLFNRFREFQEEKAVLHPFKAHPKFVFSYLEPYKESFVMEDLKADGYILKDRKEPLDELHTRLAMKEYGRLHAISFALRDQRPEEFEVLSKNTEEKYLIPEDEEDFEEMWRYQSLTNVKLLGTMDEETDADCVESLKLYCEDAVNHNINAVKTTSQYSVIGHGDCWVNNFLWKYEDPENPKIPTKMCLLDWQLARYGSPALDLSYFFYSCTDQKFRENHYDRMIKLYYYTLCVNLTEMGSDPEKMFPFSALEAELKRYSVFGFYMSSMAIQTEVSENTEVPEWKSGDDVGDFIESFNYTSVNEHLIKERIHGIILHMHQRGYFDFLKQK